MKSEKISLFDCSKEKLTSLLRSRGVVACGRIGRKSTMQNTNDLPAVIGSVWRNANDSKMAVVAVNISPARQTVRFRTPAGRDDLSAHSVDGQPAPEFAVSAGTATLTLAPRQIAILEQPAR